MTPYLKKHWRFIGVCLFLVIFYLITRLINITELPIFTDEAIYIRWSQIGSRDANWRFISLTDGKQPLFTWIMMVFFKVLKSDPLFVGRFVSVFAGLISLIGIMILAFELFQKRTIALFSGLLYILIPFTLFYDRVALYDSLVGAISIWNIYLIVLLVKYIRLDIALILGMTLGAGMLNKSSGFIHLYMLAFGLILFDWSRKNRVKRLKKLVLLMGLSGVLSIAYYGVLRLSPFHHIIGQKNAIFVYPISEWVTHPFRFFIGNMRGLFDWVINYLTKPIFTLAILTLLVKHRFKQKILLFIFFILPMAGLALFGKVLYPRFALFMSLPLIILAATGIVWFYERMNKSRISKLLILLVLVPSAYTSYFIVGDYINAPIIASDKGQFINDWPAGGGVKEIVFFLGGKAETQKLAVFTEGTFGLMPYALEIYLVDNPNISISGIWPLPKEIPEEILESATTQPTYFVTNETQSQPNWPLTLIGSYQKGNRSDRKMRIYQVQVSYVYDFYLQKIF